MAPGIEFVVGMQVMAGDDRSKSPTYRGLRICAGVGYSFAHPIDWTSSDAIAGGPEVVLAPDPADPSTLFALEVSELIDELRTEDLELLADELRNLIGDLPGSVLDELETFTAGSLNGVSTRFRFSEDGSVRQRWVRILIQGTRQLTVTAQGSTVARFEHWEPQLFTTMMSVRLHRGAEAPSANQLTV
jgi:hypothetical protein